MWAVRQQEPTYALADPPSTEGEGRRSNPDLVWERISELHARLRQQRQQHEDAAGRDQHCG
jgi:hypothetical protein